VLLRTSFRTVVLLLASLSVRTAAAENQVFYFLGEAKLSSAAGQSMGSQVLLLEKTHNPDKGVIVERAVVVKADGSAEQYTMNMTVRGDDFTIADDAQTISGSGKLFGPAWNWTYFRGAFKATNGVTIEDENFLADPSVGTARKKIIGPDGKVIMYMDVTLKSVTPETYRILARALLKK
jgi:hypothetical protein